MMKCPYCNAETRIIDSREKENGSMVARRRGCIVCEKRVTTFERYEADDFKKRKKIKIYLSIDTNENSPKIEFAKLRR